MTLCGVHDNMHVHTTVAHTCDYPLYLYRHTLYLLFLRIMNLASYQQMPRDASPAYHRMHVHLAFIYRDYLKNMGQGNL